MIKTPRHRVTGFLAENPTDTCYEWQFGFNGFGWNPFAELITASDHAQIEREFGDQGGILIGLI